MAHHSGSRSSASHPEPERRNSVTPMCLGEGFTRFLSSRSMVRIHQGAYMSHQRFSVICREPFFLIHQRLCADSTQAQPGRWCSRELCAQIAGTGTCNETSQQEQISELKLQTEMICLTAEPSCCRLFVRGLTMSRFAIVPSLCVFQMP